MQTRNRLGSIWTGAGPMKDIWSSLTAGYLSTELKAEESSEFYQGERMAMAGGSRWHNLLAGQILAVLVHHLDGKPCTPYMADMRLCIEAH